jgi:hypothetical protein
LSLREIPRLIHQLWIDASGDPAAVLPSDVQRQVDGWAALNPDYRHRLWTLDAVIALCDAEMAAAIRNCRLPSMQADLARLVLLDRFGGFWADLKLVPRQPIATALHRFDAVLVQHFPKAELPDPTGVLVNGFIGAVPGSHLIATTRALALANIGARQGDGAFALTGPGVLTTAWRSELLAGRLGMHVIPHGQAWGVLWDVGSDSYNRSGQHWALRQLREPLFFNDPLPPSPGPVFSAVPDHIARIDAVFSQQGLRPFEAGSGFSWIADPGPARLIFTAFRLFDLLRLKMYRLTGAMPDFALNGAGLGARVVEQDGGWCTVELGRFHLASGWNQITVQPSEYFTPPGDGRRLAVALAWIQPACGIPQC